MIPNQDILADGIQAQSLLIDPRVVLAFPGQKHGGPLEYPFTVAMEWIWPGNYYASSLIRVALAFLTGFLAAKLAFRLFPGTRTWALLLAMAVGPTIIHGLQLPGVWWLQPNYDMAWLLITAGALTLAHATRAPSDDAATSRRYLTAGAAGLLFGLGLFAHPVIILMAMPMATLVVLVRRVDLRAGLVAFTGLLVAIVPAAVSYFVNDEVNVWDPSHKPFISPEWLWSMGRTALGLDGIPDPFTALLPYALGFSPTQTPFPGPVQTVAIGGVLLTCLIVLATGIRSSVKHRTWLSPAAGLAASWLVAGTTMVLFITSIDPVWHYSAGLSVLAWISIGALPSLINSRSIGIGASVLAIVVFFTSTWAQNASYLSSLPTRAATKAKTLEEWHSTAVALQERGVDVVYGSYADAIPIGYASNWGLRTITNKYNRFPLTDDELGKATYVVAVRQDGDPGLGQDALDDVRRTCQDLLTDLALAAGTYTLAECPTSLLAPG